MEMTDKDALMLRDLIKRYSLTIVCQEIYRILQAYAEQNPSFKPAKLAAQRLLIIVSGKAQG